MKPKTARDRVGLPSWRSRRDAGEPASRPLPFFLLSSRHSSARRSFSLARRPLPFVVLLLPTRTFALPLILFVLSTETEKALVPPSRSPSLSDHTVAFLPLSAVSFYSSPSRAVSFCLSPLLPVATILSTRLLLPLVITVDIFCLRRNL